MQEFRQELEVMARIVHPRVVALLGAYFPKDLKKGQLKIVMELFGDDIEKMLLDPKQKVGFFKKTQKMCSSDRWRGTCRRAHRCSNASSG